MLLHYPLLLLTRFNEMKRSVVSSNIKRSRCGSRDETRTTIDELELHADREVRINSCFTSKLQLNFTARTVLWIIDVSRSRYRLAL